MARIHKVTHPIIGVASWNEIVKAADAIRKERKEKICTWCHGPIPTSSRTRCGAANCKEMILRAFFPAHLTRMVLHRDRKCPCGKESMEVDHIIPVSLGGTGDIENLRGLCCACHRLETARLRREGAAFVAALNPALYNLPKPQIEEVVRQTAFEFA